MATSRRTTLRGLSAYVQPTFFAPAPGMALFGGSLAGEFAAAPALAHGGPWRRRCTRRT